MSMDFEDEYQEKINYYYKLRNCQLYERTVRQFVEAAFLIAEKWFNEIREIKMAASPKDQKFMNDAFIQHQKKYHKFRAASMAYDELRERGRENTTHE